MSGRVTYVGHATTLIELDGVRLLTDPLLRSRVVHLRRATAPVLPAAPDAVLISHGHNDHLDRPSLRRLARDTTVVVPHGLGRVVASLKFRTVRQVLEGDEVGVGDVVVRATYADHGSRPSPGRSRAALGYVVLGSSRIYFAGDTDLFDGMTGLVPRLDVALVPIWGWGPSLGPGHLDPERAVEALRRLKPRIAIPIHWGTLRPIHVSPRAAYLREPALAFAALAKEQAPDTEVRVLQPGESTEL